MGQEKDQIRQRSSGGRKGKRVNVVKVGWTLAFGGGGIGVYVIVQLVSGLLQRVIEEVGSHEGGEVDLKIYSQPSITSPVLHILPTHFMRGRS